ncbi:hypothetical protein NRB56_28730 [Nocardia sp. RB56]|uniref:HTH tetR-type domain-containing protein n=1 Tax=Nocardia aurantia TaxID=2585199 RepID=A0A7K0DNH6_9NOCA|nr:hypothetical protein [Nocardia aurantia]
MLDAGLALLEEGGYEAFTIAAVCDRAGIAPRAVYDRVDTKDALFLAVYEHGIARVRADHAVFMDRQHWNEFAGTALAREAVVQMAAVFDRHAAFLRSVVLISGVHPEIYRRGAAYSRELGRLVSTVLLTDREHIDQPDPDLAVRAAFNTAFSTLVLRVAYGPEFATSISDDRLFSDTLVAMVQRYLFQEGEASPQ